MVQDSLPVQATLTRPLTFAVTLAGTEVVPTPSCWLPLKVMAALPFVVTATGVRRRRIDAIRRHGRCRGCQGAAAVDVKLCASADPCGQTLVDRAAHRCASRRSSQAILCAEASPDRAIASLEPWTRIQSDPFVERAT